MPLIDLIDETFIVAAPAAVSARVHDPASWLVWWPGLELTVFQDRGESGCRWTVTGELVGSCELWLEAWGDGVIAHWFLRADPTVRGSATEPVSGSPGHLRRLALREMRRWALVNKQAMNSLKDALEAGRTLGPPA